VGLAKAVICLPCPGERFRKMPAAGRFDSGSAGDSGIVKWVRHVRRTLGYAGVRIHSLTQ